MSFLFSWFLRLLGLLPVTDKGRGNRGTPNIYFCVYGLVLLALYLGTVGWAIFRFTRSDVYCNLTPLLKLVTALKFTTGTAAVSVIIMAANTQCFRKVYKCIQQNMNAFDVFFDKKSKCYERKVMIYFYRVILLLMLFHIILQNVFLLALHQQFTRLYVWTAFELFLADINQIEQRLCRLNRCLKVLEDNSSVTNHPQLSHPDWSTSHSHNKNISMLNHTRYLHQLLGETVELINSFHGCQVFACLAFALNEIIGLPVFLASIYKDFDASSNKYLLVEIFIMQISFNCLQFFYVWLVLHNSLKTSVEVGVTPNKIVSPVIL